MFLPQLKVIISGGGTGGHIFPAIAIANALKEKVKEIDFLFVGAEGRMEMEKVPAAGYRIEGLWISGLQRRLTLKNLAFPLKVISSLMKAKRILKRFRPDVVIGTGGYASGPMLRVAASRGIPTLIQEQNSFPGITNKLLAGKVDRICVAYQGMEKYFPAAKLVLTGNPVRQEVVMLDGKHEPALAHFGLEGSKKTILIIGGSLGARTINESIAASLRLFSEQGIQLIWQTGKSYYGKAKTMESGSVKVFDFISRMDLAYAAADLVISRAGAISVSELCLTGKAAILVPSPNVAEDHQTKNAMALADKEAAWLVKDGEAVEKLGKRAVDLVNDAITLERLRMNISKLAVRDSAGRIADEVLKLVK
ncbi:MAG: undecaprenyldiphospho-muramoylpentapeptide beta-N-acetylglucosaminyltransferase [Bacteroidota bacterium]